MRACLGVDCVVGASRYRLCKQGEKEVLVYNRSLVRGNKPRKVSHKEVPLFLFVTRGVALYWAWHYIGAVKNLRARK
jgi:hypothetical protein